MGLAEMILALERKEFEQWYVENAFNFERDPIGSRDCGLQWSAWQARAAKAAKCQGIRHAGCNYSAPCGSLCDKCGQFMVPNARVKAVAEGDPATERSEP